MFQVIPVLDLRDGQVVHARRGERERYQPLRSVLCEGNGPVAVMRGLLGLFPFRTVYVADLDAIQGTGDNRAVLAELATAFPQVAFWVDAAFRGGDDIRDFLGRHPGEAVLGSESLSGVAALEALRADPAWPRVVLSLDFRDRFIGPPELLERSALWTQRLIVMTLARVGSGAGPDRARLADMRRLAPLAALFAAGGVRGGDDLRELASQGVAGALVATALHDGRITAADLEAVIR
ncbi:HisA/HisF-related TIM barrel protein [Azospirillum sp. TSO35-2]|uniref:HisA/HisF-related TIM barrel protein n=1 Tax=Azospirillum sp. TSO35-2 TaxID=716796 RepID=UPI000D61D46F|nr:HisA/HisF-related TIM barrel protein [Azospirillum sp. TSO35-2]PWC37857.1 hypothetical protein TSO352_10425 [Azospirillum sp. TSO35-2]